MNSPKARPILFSTQPVLALLADLKTQTRRIAKLEPYEAGINLGFSGLEAGFFHSGLESSGWVLRSRGAGGCWNDRTKPLHCPYGRAGDQLWVRETWRPAVNHSHGANSCDCADVIVKYAADGATRYVNEDAILEAEDKTNGNWLMPKAAKTGNVSPLFMPLWASRISLEVKSVRIERLCSISEEDAVAEGVRSGPGGNWVDYTSKQQADGTYRGCVYNARDSFMTLWESITGAGSWAANPWVWRVEFKRVVPRG